VNQNDDGKQARIARGNNNEHALDIALQEEQLHNLLMLHEAVILQGACNDNEQIIARREDATIKLLIRC
jgi:hypothetical protein